MKKIPISHKRKKVSQYQKPSNNNENIKIKKNNSYTVIKSKEDNRTIQPGLTEKPKNSFNKKINFFQIIMH